MRSRFTISKVNFTASDFISHFDKNCKHPAGTCLVWDEIGVENDSRSWNSARNKLIKYLIETNRYRNYCVCLTAPTLLSFDKSTRRCLTGLVSMKGKAEVRNRARGIYYMIENRTLGDGDPYWKKPRISINGIRHVVDSFTIPRPVKIFELAYKKKKENFVSNWNKIIDREVSLMRNVIGDIKVEKKEIKDYEKEVLAEWNVFFDADANKFDANLMYTELDMSPSTARALASSLNSRFRRGLLSFKDDKWHEKTSRNRSSADTVEKFKYGVPGRNKHPIKKVRYA